MLNYCFIEALGDGKQKRKILQRPLIILPYLDEQNLHSTMEGGSASFKFINYLK